MASGATGSARMLVVSNLFAGNQSASKVGQDIQVVKTGTVPNPVGVTTTMTGDSVVAGGVAGHESSVRNTHRILKSVAAQSAAQRFKTGHG